MTRRADPERKPQLLLEIIDYLLDKSLSSLTYRTLADHLGVSTFSLVYHFGSKDELIEQVVAAICDYRRQAFADAAVSTATVDDYFATFRTFWEWTLLPRNRQLHRLEVEAAMLESLHRQGEAVTRDTLRGWHDITLGGLLELGVPADVARGESRTMAGMVYGLQYDLIVLGDVDLVNDAFERALEAYRVRIHTLVTA